MIHGYHLIACLFLIICQTTLALGGGALHLYDLLAPFAVYLGIHRLPREAIPVLLFAGLAMDSLSGGWFGLHLTTYIWMYVGVRWAIQFLHVGNVILLPLLVSLAVAFESLLAAFAAIVLAPVAWPMASMFSVVPSQLIWGAITGPFLVVLFVKGEQGAQKLQKVFFAEKNGLGTS